VVRSGCAPIEQQWARRRKQAGEDSGLEDCRPQESRLSRGGCLRAEPLFALNQWHDVAIEMKNGTIVLTIDVKKHGFQRANIE